MFGAKGISKYYSKFLMKICSIMVHFVNWCAETFEIFMKKLLLKIFIYNILNFCTVFRDWMRNIFEIADNIHIEWLPFK